MNLGLSLSLGGMRAGGGGWPPSITSSDGDPASLVDNGDNTVDVVIDGVTVGTITRAQVTAGGWITVVSPVAGMSGDDVVLTTTGYVIYVGSVSIETDIEVLANGVVVGTALPFDATAYPDEKLEVRWSFSVGFGSDLVIESLARLAPLKIAQFRDSNLNMSAGSAPGPGWPTVQVTAFMTGVMRFTITPVNNSRFIIYDGLQIDDISGGIRIRPWYSGPPSAILAPPSASPQTVSLMWAYDQTGGLPGGRSFIAWRSLNGGAFSSILEATNTTTPTLRIVQVGSTASGSAGPNFDLHNHFWLANQALDPATNWQHFFEADGTIKRLPTNGVVEGVTPVVFMVGNDFTDGTNRGSGGLVQRNRTPITVVNA
jgi:hypothetical protein